MQRTPLPEFLKPYWEGRHGDPRDCRSYCEKQARKTPTIPWHNGTTKCISCGTALLQRKGAQS